MYKYIKQGAKTMDREFLKELAQLETAFAGKGIFSNGIEWEIRLVVTYTLSYYRLILINNEPIIYYGGKSKSPSANAYIKGFKAGLEYNNKRISNK